MELLIQMVVGIAAFAIVWNTVSIVILVGAVGEFADVTDAVAIAVGLIGVGEINAVVEIVRYAVTVGIDRCGAGAQRQFIDPALATRGCRRGRPRSRVQASP